jgi:hypothetical protein
MISFANSMDDGHEDTSDTDGHIRTAYPDYLARFDATPWS